MAVGMLDTKFSIVPAGDVHRLGGGEISIKSTRRPERFPERELVGGKALGDQRNRSGLTCCVEKKNPSNYAMPVLSLYWDVGRASGPDFDRIKPVLSPQSLERWAFAAESLGPKTIACSWTIRIM